MVFLEFDFCGVEQVLHVWLVNASRFQAGTHILFVIISLRQILGFGKYLCASLLTLISDLHEKQFADLIKCCFRRQFVIITNDVVTSLQSFCEFLARKRLCLVFNLLDFLSVIDILGSRYSYNFLQLLREKCRINIKEFSFLLVCGNKEIGMCPSSIIKALIVILHADFYIFRFALYNDKSRFSIVFVLLTFPDNNICTSLTLPTLRIVDF